MARINPPARQSLLAALLNKVLARRFGKPFPTVTLLGHHPAYPLPYALMAAIYGNGRTSIPAHTRSLVTQLVAQVNACGFCIDLGQRLALERSSDLEKLQRVLEFETNSLFSHAERAALRYALEATQVGARVNDETFAELRVHYNDREILELTVAVATENFFNRLTGPLELESQGFCSLTVSSRHSR